MGDARRQEQPRKLRSLFRASHLLLDAFVVVDGSLCGDELIRPTVPQNGLAATVAETSKVRVISSDYNPVLLYRLIPEMLPGCGRDGSPVKPRILSEEVSQPVQRDTKHLRL